MKRIVIGAAAAAMCAAIVGCKADKAKGGVEMRVPPKTATRGAEQFRPKLFVRFGEEVNEPDGLTQDNRGNIFHSAPNHLSKAFPGQVLKRDFATGTWSVFCTAAKSPKTGVGRPMGLEWCPEDGNLYYCDNQYFDSKDYASRVMRVVIDPNTGNAVRIETAVDNIKLANAIRFYKGDMFITDTYFDLNRADGVGVGGVYRIPLAECRDRTVSLLPKEQFRQDPHFVANTETVALPGRAGDISGADGLAITKEGHLYFGTFGSGRFYTCKRSADGTYGAAKLLFENPKLFPCCDGICYDAEKNRIIMTDSALNAIHTWDIAKEADPKAAFGELWSNADDDGAFGLLDQPCEPLIWRDGAGRRKLIIANFDMKFPGLVNQNDDEYHTLSVIDLD